MGCGIIGFGIVIPQTAHKKMYFKRFKQSLAIYYLLITILGGIFILFGLAGLKYSRSTQKKQYKTLKCLNLLLLALLVVLGSVEVLGTKYLSSILADEIKCETNSWTA